MKKIDGTQNMRRLFSRPNIVPLYGVMLAILLPFSIIPPTSMKRYHHVDLPETGYYQEDFEKCELTVSIDVEGRIWLEDRLVDNESEFTGLLQDLVEERRANYRICLKADKDTLYEKSKWC